MYIKTGTEEEQLFRKLYYPPKAAVKFEIFPGLRVLGAFFKRNMSDLEHFTFEQYTGYGILVNALTFYNRVQLWNDFFVYGLDYKRMSHRNCSAIKYRGGNTFKFGMVKTFFQYNDHRSKCFNGAFVYPLEVLNSSELHIYVVKPLNKEELVAVDITDIISNCLFVNIEDVKDRAYISEFPNKLESD